MKQSKFPPGWEEQRVRKVIAHYQAQTEDEAIAEDEAMLQDQSQAVMEIPMEQVINPVDMVGIIDEYND
ncbi:MAG: hypothetical protein JNK95_07895 [Candidatus Competibacter sp.]|nr:hypothetical protein [Candidatus Competibacter sp.]MDG4606606.1 hypothetical protein [Candidatus Contendobacter sp.]HRD50064.1 hypothetical protein [Candidatus Contendobacter sp.]